MGFSRPPACENMLLRHSMQWVKETGVLTLRDGEERERHDSLTVSTSHLVVNIPEGHVHGMELLVVGGNRDGRFISAKDNRCEHGAM